MGSGRAFDPKRAIGVGLVAAIALANLAAADQALVDAACAGQPVDRGERALDPNDPVDAAMAARFGSVCEEGQHRALLELTALSFGDGLRTYRCKLWVPQRISATHDAPRYWKAIDDAFGADLRASISRPGRPLLLAETRNSLGQGLDVLLLTRNGMQVEPIHFAPDFEARTVRILSIWGAADLIALTNDTRWASRRPSLCGKLVETEPSGWVIRGVHLGRNCGRAYVRDYKIGRDAKFMLLANEEIRTSGPCAD